jgi:hypothetical protein
MQQKERHKRLEIESVHLSAQALIIVSGILEINY